MHTGKGTERRIFKKWCFWPSIRTWTTTQQLGSEFLVPQILEGGSYKPNNSPAYGPVTVLFSCTYTGGIICASQNEAATPSATPPPVPRHQDKHHLQNSTHLDATNSSHPPYTTHSHQYHHHLQYPHIKINTTCSTPPPPHYWGYHHLQFYQVYHQLSSTQRSGTSAI